MMQDKIWKFYQTDGLEKFGGSIPRLRFLVNQIQKYSHKKGLKQPRILNIGIGNGWLEIECKRRGWNVYSLDPDNMAVHRLLEQGITAKVGYIEEIPYDDNIFDFVICSEVIEHLSDNQIQLGLLEIGRVLSKNGILLGTVPYNENLLESQVVCPNCGQIFHRWGHQQSFDVGSLSKIFPSLFQIEKIKIILFIDYFSSWKKALLSLPKKVLSLVGLYGRNCYNMFFVIQKI